VEQQNIVQKLDPLQEESFRVTKELATTQGIMKQVAQYSVDKLKNPITAHTVDEIVAQEFQAKENIATRKGIF
jgi:hypothetical protein